MVQREHGRNRRGETVRSTAHATPEGGIETLGSRSLAHGFIIGRHGLVSAEANGANQTTRELADRKRSRCALLRFESTAFRIVSKFYYLLLSIALARAERVEKRWHIVDRVRRTLG